ncbi:PLP-dependent aminotransferase family protein [Sorangium sp. So ce1097]|uniref:MocR-like pyridoxine biosynthesis transcription factor PdxR n=1 Tax=Sorangium sp. So ce1097 TaxID=3133330 RepID=UPI003F615B02
MFGIVLDRASRRSLALQLADGLRKAVVTGELAPGARLPPSRQLAAELGISRRLVTDAYEQLTGEGYFETRAGHGTYAAALPVRAPHASVAGASAPRRHRPIVRFDFTPGIPDLASFPRQAWRRAADDAISLALAADLSYGPALGDARLRQAISDYLYRFRGLAADPAQICITSGTSHSLSLLSRLLPATTLFCEEPGLTFARDVFASAGFRCRPVHVDDAGALPSGLGDVPRGALFYLTPSHQFPTGALLPLKRRVRFLELAAPAEGLVLEDDYDSEFRFRGSPVPPLASLDAERVVYLGTFSKCLAPFVRVGYLIAPPRLVGPIADLVRRTNLRGSIPHQRALARFIEEGHIERHIFAMKRRYRARLEAILAFLGTRYGDEVRTGGGETGFHLHVRFGGRRFGPGFADACSAAGLRISTEDEFRAEPSREGDALVIGYGNVADEKLDEGLELLGALVERCAEGGELRSS